MASSLLTRLSPWLRCSPFYRSTRRVYSDVTAPVKKFYKNVSISQASFNDSDQTAFEVLLDQRKLRTPGGKPLLLPNEILALAVAQEWDAQKDTINRHCMHITALCNRVVDVNETSENPTIIRNIMQFAETDTICYRCREPNDLLVLQKRSWDPVIEWVREHYSISPTVTDSLVIPTILSRGDRDILKRHFASYNRWALVGFQACVENLKSVLLTLATVDGYCSAIHAVELSLLEQLFQVHHWGEILSHHDVELIETKARVSAAVFLILTSHQRRQVKNKLEQSDLRRLVYGHDA